jgi:tetratricopeptide (TPR) repeat protein
MNCKSMSRSKGLLRMLVPSATVFFAGGCIVILELVAVRLVARDLGSSLYTWTAILGVVLGGIALGSYLGGQIADRYHARRALAVLFGSASAACVSIIIVNNFVGNWTWLWRLSWPTHVFIHVALVFLLPSVLLGTISPVVARMALDRGLPAGRTLGNIYAWAVAGSIAGVFLAGFYLIPTFGSATIIWGIGAAMLAMALLYWVSCWVMYVWAMIFGALLAMGMAPADWAEEAGAAAMLRRPSDPSILYEDETPYRHIVVQQTSSRPDRRTLQQDALLCSEAAMGVETGLPHFHAKVYAGLTHGLSEGLSGHDLSMLVLGSGGYALPRYLKATWPGGHVEVVETDPAVTEAAMAAFGLDRNTAIRIVHADARVYINRILLSDEAAGRYDFIYGNAIKGYAVPFQLVTREFNEKIARLLTDDGVYLLHLTDTYASGRFLGAVVGTIRETFPHVHVITGEVSPPGLPDTFVVVASRRQIDPQAILVEHSRHLKFRLLGRSEMDTVQERAGRILLTDDYAPVERLLAPVVRHSATEILARRHFQNAVELQVGGRHEQSIRKYRQALALCPSLAVRAYNEIGLMHLAQDKPQEAAGAFRDAIEAHARAGGGQIDVASAHMHFGRLLRRMNRDMEAREHLARAAEWFRIELEENPGSVVVWEWLGDTVATLGDLKEASAAFGKAAALEPENLAHYEKLAKALAQQHRYDEAISVVRKHIQLVQDQGRRDLAIQLRHYVDLLEYQRAKHAR